MDSLFYIGQKIVAIRNHRFGKFKIGQEFSILDIKSSCCGFILKINNDYSPAGQICGTCYKDIDNATGDYYREFCFAPIQNKGSMTYEDAINLVSEKITV